MAQGYEHRPVMVAEVVATFGAVPPGLVLDATVGGGGHAGALLASYPGLRVLGIDQDRDAVDAARVALRRWSDRAEVRHWRFDGIDRLATAGSLSGVLFDLGVSSPQLDRPERGFSYREDGPLDMRMDRTGPTTAYDVVNGMPLADLARLLAENGEGRFATRIARGIVAARPVSTTSELARAAAASIPAAARRSGGHPAKRVFQAVRVAVNSELDVLGPAIDAAIELLAPGGRCVVLSYHSGEDRIVKGRFAFAESGGCTCPPRLPCTCGARPKVRVLNRRARRPSREEMGSNPRSSSARMRAVERVADGTAGAGGEPGAGERVA